MSGSEKPHILVVEDDPDTCQALTKLIELEGFSVTQARDGAEAYLKASATPPDVVITDVRMPAVSGLDLIRLMKRDASLSAIPIIVLTAETSQTLEEAMGLGAAEGMSKPVEFDQLKSMLLGIVTAVSRKRTAMTQSTLGDTVAC